MNADIDHMTRDQLKAEILLLRHKQEIFEKVCPDYIAGEPMVCEQHPWRLWSSKDEGCPVPACRFPQQNRPTADD